MRRVPSVAVTVVVVVAVAAGSVFVAREHLAGFIFRETTSTGSESLFLDARDVAELETFTVVHKTVFPHDFFMEETHFYALLDRVRRADAPAREVLTPDELDHFQAVSLSQRLGLATGPGQPGYVVVTTTLRYGYDLSRLEEQIRSRIDQTAADGSIESAITIPPAHLLSQETEDLSREDYPYSPVYLDAEGWQAVATFVSARLLRGDPDEETISQATATGIELLETLTTRRFEVRGPETD
ncbi:MAG: hypothetical protein WD492_13335 [Alkalispirochaeta sp.]